MLFLAEQWQNVSVEARDFIDLLLEANVEDRMSAYEALNHPWIVDNSPPPDINLNQDLEDEI